MHRYLCLFFVYFTPCFISKHLAIMHWSSWQTLESSQCHCIKLLLSSCESDLG